MKECVLKPGGCLSTTDAQRRYRLKYVVVNSVMNLLVPLCPNFRIEIPIVTFFPKFVKLLIDLLYTKCIYLSVARLYALYKSA